LRAFNVTTPAVLSHLDSADGNPAGDDPRRQIA
jgi:hypothetical protein